MNLKRGMRDKLDKYVNLNNTIEITMGVNGPDVYDFCCFGVDSAEKLSDDRYMIFYNQISSPYNEIIYSSSGSSALFTIKLSGLPTNIQKLVFTVSIDGNSTMGNISSHSLSLKQSGREVISLSLDGNDFRQEKAIISIEIYKKDVWRINAVARGFNGGLGDLLRAYGGEEITSEPQSPPSVQTTSAEDLDNQAVDLYQQACYELDFEGNYEKALNLFKESAELGYIPAQEELQKLNNSNLKSKYELDNKSTKTAEDLYNEAEALLNEELFEKAFDLLKQSADLGHTEAQVETGIGYFYGFGTEEDDEKAFEYFKKAADKNNADAQYWIGEMYYNGNGVKENDYEAVKWYTKAANNGNLDAMYMLGECYYDGNGVKENFQQAVSWYKKGSDKGHSGCQYKLGLCYWEGNGTKQNKNLAFDLFQKSANQGYPLANNELGLIYDSGDGRKADKQKAIEYYQIAAEAGLAVAMSNLGVTLYEENNDIESAKEWLEKAIEAGYEDAQEALDDILGNTDNEYDDSSVQNLRINFFEPMDTTYYPEKHEDYYFANNDINFNPYGIMEDKNFIYSLFFYVNSDCGKKILNIMTDAENFKNTGNSKYDDIFSSFNDLTKCYELDASEETENQRANNARMITDKLYSYSGSNILTNTLKEIYTTVNEMYDFIDNKYQQNIYNQISREEYVDAASKLFNLNERLNNMIDEIASDMNANKNKVFSYFHEAGSNIVKVLHFKLDFISSEFDYNYSNYKAEYKSADIKATAAAVGGGALFGALSLIPAVNKTIINVTDKFYESSEKMYEKISSKYRKQFEAVIYLSAVVLAFDISNLAVKWLIDDCDFDDENDNFFDEI